MTDQWGGAQAIETVYAGVRFRSRLEARWAVFMDAAGVRWDYEPEAFQLGSYRYSPDFWLADHGYWVEIKPDLETQSYEAVKSADRKADLLAAHTGKLVFVLAASFQREGGIGNSLAYLPEPLRQMFPFVDGALWASCLECGSIGLTIGYSDLTPMPCGHEALGTNPVLANAWRQARGWRHWDPR